MHQAGGTKEESTQTGDEAIGSEEMRGPVPRTIQDQELLLDKNELGDRRTDAARTQKSGDGRDEMDEKDRKIARIRMVARN